MFFPQNRMFFCIQIRSHSTTRMFFFRKNTFTWFFVSRNIWFIYFSDPVHTLRGHKGAFTLSLSHENAREEKGLCTSSKDITTFSNTFLTYLYIITCFLRRHARSGTLQFVCISAQQTDLSLHFCWCVYSLFVLTKRTRGTLILYFSLSETRMLIVFVLISFRECARIWHVLVCTGTYG